ncbi:MAG: restriction endonuclease subunit S [Bacteroidales bacterium]|nr:restriction endonuclease subunit S [Bacteroidales bacterium]
MNKNQHIPQGYKSSPLGIIPEDWEVKRLGEIAEITSGTTPLRANRSYYDGGTIPWVKTTDLNNKELFDTEEYVSEIAVSKTSLKLLPKGTVLVAMYGGFNQIGRTSILGIEATINQALSALICNDKVLNFYVLAWLNGRVGDWKNLAASSRKDPNITGKDVERFHILVPKKEEQQRIVSVLSLWDTAISKQTQLVEKLTLRKRGLMQQLLTGKKRLKGFEGEWSYHTIQDHFTEIRDKNDGEGHIPMTISAKLGLISQTHKFDRVVAGNSLDKYTLLRKGDFAYNKGNSNLYEMGCIYRLKEESAVVPFVYICFRVIDKTCCEFYQQFFINHGLDKQLKQIITSGARGDGLLNVNSEDFMALKIPYPSIEEQNAIASVLVQADQEIEIQKQKLARLQEQKKGLMQVLLTGKRRVK